MKKLFFILFATVILAGGGVFLWRWTASHRTIQRLLAENRQLQEAIANLAFEQQIGYAKVLEQGLKDGRLFTKILFVQTAPEEPSLQILRKEVETEGDVAHFDILIVRFSNQLVMDGRERAIGLWRRVYGENMRPADGISLEQEGVEPAQYANICRMLSSRDRRLFWQEIWSLSNQPKRLESLGISAVYGNAVYRQMRPGLIYVFKLSSTGAFWAEVIPDL
jgi:hypothetical protein